MFCCVYMIFDWLMNHAGFSSPLMACCGFGGPPYNYNIHITCGQPGAQVCDEESKFVSWDGIHYTEAANNIVASKIQSNAFSTPQVAFDFFCHWCTFSLLSNMHHCDVYKISEGLMKFCDRKKPSYQKLIVRIFSLSLTKTFTLDFGQYNMVGN